MKVYNTLTRKKEEFKPLIDGRVGFYICGPTVYNDIHIGNARTFLSFDVIRRYLEYLGYEVTYVQNLTDVDDKIINKAAEEGIEASALAEKYANAFINVMRAVGVKDPTIRPRATTEIDAMIELIECLIAKGHAYAVPGLVQGNDNLSSGTAKDVDAGVKDANTKAGTDDTGIKDIVAADPASTGAIKYVENSDVYFSVRSFDAYGELSGRDIEQLLSGARVDVDTRKRDPLDFALWKAAKPGEPSWDSPWGWGRPGWHIECSAMSARYLGIPFDIHAGGDDLVFPHHENERAQSEACTQRKFANYWLHGGMLTLNSEKMSKSEGNFLLLKDVLEHVRPQALRLLMLQTHYRSTFDYSPARLDEATAALERVESALRNTDWLLSCTADVPTVPNDISDKNVSWTSDLLKNICECREQFVSSMDDDFNTAGAVAALFDLITACNSSIKDGIKGDTHRRAVAEAAATIVELFDVLGVKIGDDAGQNGYSAEVAQGLIDLASELADCTSCEVDTAVEAILDKRTNARASKDWALADALRDRLSALGLQIEDTAQGTRVVNKG